MLSFARMIDSTQLEFLTAWGEEFAGSLGFVSGLEHVSQHDGGEAFRDAFKTDPTPALLASLSGKQLEQLRAAAQKRLETLVPLERIRDAVARTVARYPADG